MPGSGKTTLMAARVVYLVGTGQVRARRGARADLHDQGRHRAQPGIRAALEKPGCSSAARRDGRRRGDVLEPTVATYNAYAATLLTDHGLRIGHEPDTRVVTDAARYQLGARVVDRHTGQVAHLTDHPPTAIQNLLALDGAMSEHLVSPDERARASTPRPGRASSGRSRSSSAGKDRKTYREPPRRPSSPSTGAPSCSTSSRATGR